MSSRPSRDEIFVVNEPFEAMMRVYWRTPSIEERRVILPAEFEMKVMSDPTLIAREASLQAVDVTGWESTFVSEQERMHPMYGGYAFLVPFADLREKCVRAAS